MAPNFDHSDIELDEALPALIAMGFPTFDEFRKNPDKWRKGKNEVLESADTSSITFKDQVKRQVYMWRNQYTCKTLEQLETICKSEGYDPRDLQMRPIVKPISGTSQQGQVEIVIQFWPSGEYEARGGKVIFDK
jgi:hypothetical protein